MQKHMEDIQRILEENDSQNMSDRGIDPLLQKRLEFAVTYAKEKKWNPKELTTDQIMEIRKQQGWKNPEGAI